MTAFTFTALPSSLLDETREREVAARRAVSPEPDGGAFPVRCCLRDVADAEDVLLVSVRPPSADSPYAAHSPVYVHREPCDGHGANGAMPEVLRNRLLSLRAYTAEHMITGTATEHGRHAARAIAELLADPRAEYVFVHFAGPGCYVCRVDRAAA